MEKTKAKKEELLNKSTFETLYFSKLAKENGSINCVEFKEANKKSANDAWKEYQKGNK